MIPVSPAQRKATDKYIREKFDELKVRVPKGKKESILAHAEQYDDSLNAFLNRAIRETIARDTGVGLKVDFCLSGKEIL